MNCFLAILISILFLPAFSYANNDCDHPRTTYDQSYCLARQFVASDDQLNAVYQQLRNKLNGNQRRQLVESQLDWLQKRNSQCLKQGKMDMLCSYKFNISRIEYLQFHLRQSEHQYTFNPMNFSNLVLWLDAANPYNDGTLPSDNSSLTTWVDISGQSGNARSSEHPPIFKTRIQNNLPGILFESASLTSLFIHQTTALDCTFGMSIFIVSNDNSGGNYVVINKRTSDGSLGWQFSTIFGGGQNSGLQYCNSSNDCVYSDTTFKKNQTHLWSCISSYNKTKMYNNSINIYSAPGVTPTSVRATTAIGSDRGNSNFYNGYVHEILIFNTALNSEQQALVNSYLRRKWAIY